MIFVAIFICYPDFEYKFNRRYYSNFYPPNKKHVTSAVNDRIAHINLAVGMTSSPLNFLS